MPMKCKGWWQEQHRSGVYYISVVWKRYYRYHTGIIYNKWGDRTL